MSRGNVFKLGITASVFCHTNLIYDVNEMMKYAIHSDILSMCLPLPQHPATLTATRCESSAVSGSLSVERLLLDDSDTLTTDHQRFSLELSFS